MVSSPLVSIVMPAYNCEAFIEIAIGSILEQTYFNFELLIADDASKDRTKDIIDQISDPRIRIYHNESNLGYLRTCNKLLNLASGDLITFQDADDWSSTSRLAIQVDAFKKNSTIDVIGTCGVLVDPKGEFIRNSIRPHLHSEIIEQMKDQNPFIGASIMITKKAKEAFPGYNEYFHDKGWEDYDWAYRMSSKFECLNLQEELYFYRQHPASLSKQISLDKHLGKETVLFLAKQRKLNDGKDGLNDEALKKELEDHIAQLKAPYLEDPSLLYRELASTYMYGAQNRLAIKASRRAISCAPLKLVNYRTLFYCLRKSI